MQQQQKVVMVENIEQKRRAIENGREIGIKRKENVFCMILFFFTTK